MRGRKSPTPRRAILTAVTPALCAPGLALAHGGHAEVGLLAHPLAHASFFLAAALIAVPALVWVARRLR
ncbi:MAG: hypothetical protein V2J24_01220 [Pseudomonadales bacterium]|jgi:hypothetical protein|nr:hypothetical protein [Pseudomonadales bacterium]